MISNSNITNSASVVGTWPKVKEVEKLVSNYGELSSIQEAPIEELSDTKLSKLKIKAIKNGLKRLKFTVELEK